MSSEEKRGRSDDDIGAPGVGRGSGTPTGRPPGLPPSIQDTLAAIQAQLTLQTDRMQNLAEKDDVRSLSEKLEKVGNSVACNTKEIEKMKTDHAEDQVKMSD